jgi:hypothetical protein
MYYMNKWLDSIYSGQEPSGSIDRKKLYVTVIFLSCKTTENLRTVRDVYNSVSTVLDSSQTLADLDKVILIYAIAV